MLQTWSAGRLGLRTFRAKVGHANAPSLALFRKLGYALVSSSAVFEEVRASLNVRRAFFPTSDAPARRTRLSCACLKTVSPRHTPRCA